MQSASEETENGTININFNENRMKKKEEKKRTVGSRLFNPFVHVLRAIQMTPKTFVKTFSLNSTNPMFIRLNVHIYLTSSISNAFSTQFEVAFLVDDGKRNGKDGCVCCIAYVSLSLFICPELLF